MTMIYRVIGFAILATAVIVPRGPVHTQELVWDPAEIAHLAEKSAEMAEALSRAVELLSSVNDLSRTVGRFGALSNLDFTHLDVVDGLQGAGPDIGGLASNIAGVEDVKVGSFDDASAFVIKLFAAPPGGARTTGAAQAGRVVEALYRTAVEDGFALSMHTRDGLSVAPLRAKLLVAQASATNDARGDAGADTAAALAVLEQLGSLKAMLASILEIQATAALRMQMPGRPSAQ